MFVLSSLNIYVLTKVYRNVSDMGPLRYLSLLLSYLITLHTSIDLRPDIQVHNLDNRMGTPGGEGGGGSCNFHILTSAFDT